MPGEAVNSMFGVVVVPRHSIVIQKREELATILFEATLVAPGEVGLKFSGTRLGKEYVDFLTMSLEVFGLEAVAVHGHDHLPQEGGKSVCQDHQFFIKWVAEDIL